jgi:hypothetical protein
VNHKLIPPTTRFSLRLSIHSFGVFPDYGPVE